MIDQFISQIEQLQADGAVVLLKWDGERQANRITVIVTRRATDYIWRKDSDDLSLALREALHDYRAKHAH
jgi:hypothetical protein